MLADEICAFLTGGVSIFIASRNASMEPSIARARGCRVLRGPQTKLRILISAAHAGEVLADVRATRMIAVTFSGPDTHRTLQLKGDDASIATLEDEDRAVMERYLPAFAASVAVLGFSSDFVRAFFVSPPDEIAIEFTPTDAFQQTPGPAAGKRLP
jgi:hypothetical protein